MSLTTSPLAGNAQSGEVAKHCFPPSLPLGPFHPALCRGREKWPNKHWINDKQEPIITYYLYIPHTTPRMYVQYVRPYVRTPERTCGSPKQSSSAGWMNHAMPSRAGDHAPFGLCIITLPFNVRTWLQPAGAAVFVSGIHIDENHQHNKTWLSTTVTVLVELASRTSKFI